MYKLIVVSIFLVLVSKSSCNKDTCNDKKTFANLHGDFVGLTSNLLIASIIWEKEEKGLPQKYFEKIHLITGMNDLYGMPWDNDYKKIDKIEIVSDRELKIYFIPNLPDVYSDTLNFHFEFPDRVGFLDCEHPGSSDRYYLDVEFKVEKLSDDQFIMQYLNWEETLVKGAF